MLDFATPKSFDRFAVKQQHAATIIRNTDFIVADDARAMNLASTSAATIKDCYKRLATYQ